MEEHVKGGIYQSLRNIFWVARLIIYNFFLSKQIKDFREVGSLDKERGLFDSKLDCFAGGG